MTAYAQKQTRKARTRHTVFTPITTDFFILHRSTINLAFFHILLTNLQNCLEKIHSSHQSEALFSGNNLIDFFRDTLDESKIVGVKY